MRKTKAFKFASKMAIPTLIALMATAIGSVFMMFVTFKNASNENLRYIATHPLATLFNYNLFKSGLFISGQVLANLASYIFMIAAIVMFVLSLVVIKHDNKVKIKSAILSLLLFVPATIGLAGGIIDFFGHGLRVCLHAGGKGAIVAFGLVLTYALDIAYLVLCAIYLIASVPHAIRVNRGEEPAYDEEEADASQPKALSAYDQAKKDDEELEKRSQLLKDIRQIVKEELEKLDRVAIVREEVVVKEVAKVVKEPAVVEEAEEEEDDPKKPAAPRVPFAQKMVKAEKDIQDKYNELKNELLAYGVSSRVSIGGDTFRLHRKPYVKITLVGKILKVYFALNPNDFKDSPIPVVDASDKATYEEVPALLKVKSNLSVKRAKDLIAMAFAKDGILKEEEVKDHNFIRDLRAELRNKK